MPMKPKLDNNEAAGILKQCCCWPCPPIYLCPFSLISSLSHGLFRVFTARSRMGTQPQVEGSQLPPTRLSQAKLHLLSCSCQLPGTCWDSGISKLHHGKADSHGHKHSLRNSLGCCRKLSEKKMTSKLFVSTLDLTSPVSEVACYS